MDDPFIIHPYYTGRDKGALCETPSGALLTFINEGKAWWYIFHTAQPDDIRACNNYRVIRLSQYLGNTFECEQQCGRLATVYAIDSCAGGWGGRYCKDCASALSFQIVDLLLPPTVSPNLGV